MKSRHSNLLTLSAVSFVVLAAALGCQAKAVIEKGKAVKFNYTLTVEGKIVDSSQGKQPLSYVQGAGMIIPGLEEAMLGLKVGDKKHVTVAPEKGYGPINPKALQKIPKANFGKTEGLKPGMMVSGNAGGRPIQAKVVEIGKKDITLDMNHPLAGKTLDFDVEIVEIAKAPEPSAPGDMPPAHP
jgi:FKBP-type peptidyl-prolyl cis-trans isomerase SlyD